MVPQVEDGLCVRQEVMEFGHVRLPLAKLTHHLSRSAAPEVALRTSPRQLEKPHQPLLKQRAQAYQPPDRSIEALRMYAENDW
jgi:hypothetical protein